MPTDPLGPAKGILLALLISSVLWYVIYHLIALALWLCGGDI